MLLMILHGAELCAGTAKSAGSAGGRGLRWRPLHPSHALLHGSERADLQKKAGTLADEGERGAKDNRADLVGCT